MSQNKPVTYQDAVDYLMGLLGSAQRRGTPAEAAEMEAMLLQNGRFDPEEWIERGFITRAEVTQAEAMARAIVEGRVHQRPDRVMRYPWSEWSPSSIRALMEGSVDEAVAKVSARAMAVARQHGSPWSETDKDLGLRLLFAVARWGRSKRRLVNVSRAAQSVLLQVAEDRMNQGLSPCRWASIPSPGSPMYEEGIILSFDNLQSLTFVEATGGVLDEAVHFTAWHRIAADPEHARRGYSKVWGTQAFVPTRLNRAWFREALDIEDWRSPGLCLVHMTINALAALATEYEVSVSRRGRKRKGKTAYGGFSRVRAVELDERGLATWSKRFVDLTDPDDTDGEDDLDTASEGTGEPVGEREPVALHVRDPTLARVWVREENVEPGEYVDGTKTEGDQTYCRVYRKRAGAVVGGELKPRRERLRAGPDDIKTD